MSWHAASPAFRGRARTGPRPPDLGRLGRRHADDARLVRGGQGAGAPACGRDFALRAQTIDYPAPLSCGQLGTEVRPGEDFPAEAWRIWSSVFSVPGGQVHATAVPLVSGEAAPIGFVGLVHDLSFVER